MGCYCGCGTKAAKIRWLCAILATAIAAAFFITFVGHIGKCASDLNDAEDANPDDVCVKEFRDNEGFEDDVSEECHDRFPECRRAGIFFWVFLPFAILASIPCYMMCCCSQKPHSNQHEVAMAVPAQPPAGYATGTPGYGTAAQPVYATPAYGADGKPVQYGTGTDGTAYGTNPAV